jgi:thioredoxin-like negative regulator of GroEL
MLKRMTLGAVLVLMLGSCDSPGGGVGAGFRAQYAAARDALEDGRYATATRKYGRLAQQHAESPLSARLNLELSHALLRAGDYEQAANVARAVASRSTGRARRMAHAVVGTAEHQIARQRMAQGDNGAETGRRLEAALAAFDAFLADGTELDLGGAMERRRAQVRAELRSRG